MVFNCNVQMFSFGFIFTVIALLQTLLILPSGHTCIQGLHMPKRIHDRVKNDLRFYLLKVFLAPILANSTHSVKVKLL